MALACPESLDALAVLRGIGILVGICYHFWQHYYQQIRGQCLNVRLFMRAAWGASASMRCTRVCTVASNSASGTT